MLPSRWVDELFERLGVRYGAAFMRQWPDADPAAVKADWANVLSGFGAHPDAIAYALENLPERPVNALQFRELCRRAPAPNAPRLPAPKADRSVAAAALAKLRTLRNREPSNDWAVRLRSREQAGEPLTLAQREAWRVALREGAPSQEALADLQRAKDESLERVMRYAAERGISLGAPA